MKSVKFAIAATLFAAASGAFATTDERGGYDVAPFATSTVTRATLSQGGVSSVANDERGDYGVKQFQVKAMSRSASAHGDSMVTSAISERHMAL